MKDRVTSRWERTLLVCRKCGKRSEGGFGPDGTERLAKALRRRIGGKGRKASIGVVEIGCVDVCPKNATVVIDGGRPGEWLLVKAGTDLEAVAARLGLPGAAPPHEPGVIARLLGRDGAAMD